MNKLNISCILKLIDQLSHEDYVKLREILVDPVWKIVSHFGKPEIFYIRALDLDDIITKMIEKGIPLHQNLEHSNDIFFLYKKNKFCELCNKKRLFKNQKLDNQINENMINILIDGYCILCNSKICYHSKNNITCLKKDSLKNNDIIQIIKCMIENNFYTIVRI